MGTLELVGENPTFVQVSLYSEGLFLLAGPAAGGLRALCIVSHSSQTTGSIKDQSRTPCVWLSFPGCVECISIFV